VFFDRNRLPEARAAIEEAIRLDSTDADQFSLLAGIHFRQSRWKEALAAAEQGLEFDSEHAGCVNLRAMAMVKLGRRAEAGVTIDAALARHPENAITHANQGWTLLHKGEPKKALEHFKEALRLDPENEWARLGIVEALKARNIVYAMMLKYFLWMSRFSVRGQWGIILGAYFGNRLLGAVAANNPAIAPWVLPLRVIYIVFALMTWLASPFFNLLLRMNRFGRLVLSREETIASNWFGLTLFCALNSFAGCLFFGFDSPWLIAACVFGFLLLPVGSIYKCDSGWPRTTMAAISIGMAVVGLASVAAFTAANYQPRASARQITETAEGLFGFFLIGAVGSTWAANILRGQTVRK
jgi:hypothetical protein